MEEPSEDDTGEYESVSRLYQAASHMRREQAGAIIVSACELLKQDMPDEQKSHVQQMLFSALRLYLEARRNAPSGCLGRIFLPVKTPWHRLRVGAYEEEIITLYEKLLADPAASGTILER
jgi:hypothetical protein